MSELTLTLEQPAQVGDRPRKESVLTTLDYVPGSVIRGAFAANWIAAHGAPERGNPKRAEFIRLFEGGVRFGSLLPDDAEDACLSVVTHKHDPADCGDIEFDRVDSTDAPANCADCLSPLIVRPGLRGDRTPRPPHRRTSVQIGTGGVAEPGKLFTRETLSPGQRFRGTIAGDPELLGILAALGPVRVGGRRTTHGLGAVTIDSTVPPPGPQRLDDTRIVLRLRSPGIFTDEQGRPAAAPTQAYLERLLGTKTEVIRSWTRWQHAGGWHIASGLPKTAELAVAPGSAYLVESQRPVPHPTLTLIASNGIGLRRHEGFGDLAPPPRLREGANARKRERERLDAIMEGLVPLRGLRVNWPGEWQQAVALMSRHADGDAAATSQLTQISPDLFDASVAAALRRFAAVNGDDAANVLRALGFR